MVNAKSKVAKNKKIISIKEINLSAILIAIGIIIPVFSPFKIMLEPASFTLASHVPIFIGMMISPLVAVCVAIGTAVGFIMSGMPIVVGLRAISHIVFALIGSIYLSKYRNKLNTQLKNQIFSFVIAIIHAVCEILCVIPFYFQGNMSEGYYRNGFFISVVMLVGIGTIVHSMVDYQIAYFIMKSIGKAKNQT